MATKGHGGDLRSGFEVNHFLFHHYSDISRTYGGSLMVLEQDMSLVTVITMLYDIPRIYSSRLTGTLYLLTSISPHPSSWQPPFYSLFL